jgi:hypothetical protein
VVAAPTGTPPSSTSLPTIAGTAQSGQTLTATSGTWNGTAPIATSYQWRQCDSAGTACTDILGAISSSYTLAFADLDHTVRVVVTALNSGGSAAARSLQTAIVVGDTLPGVSGICGTAAAPPPTWDHVIWIWMENRSYTQIVGSPDTPYINSVAGACGLANAYAGVAHPSLPNYIAATSGGTQGVTDNLPPTSHPLAVESIYSQVRAAGLTWRDYEESATKNCPSANSSGFAVRHDPAPYYTGIAADCANWDVPLGSLTAGTFLSDLAAGTTLPNFAFVTPNLCNDMHDCGVTAGDNWLRTWLPKIVASPAYVGGTTAIFVTWDENDGSAGNRVATIVISPSTLAGTVSSTAFNHYSLLRTTEEMFGLTAFLGNAATAASMRADFHL